MEIIVEQLGTSHNVIDRQRYDTERITIGRSYANDVILTDEHVDAFHASIDFREGRWQITDLDSINGVQKRGVRKPQVQWDIESGDIFILGRNKIRVLMADHPIPAATPIRQSEQFLLWLGRWPVLISLCLIYVALSVFSAYLQITSEVNWRPLVLAQVQVTLTYLFLVVCVYLLSILFKRSGHFLSHLGVLALIAVIISVLNGLMKLLWFNTSSEMSGVLEISQEVIDHAALFAYFWCILYLAFHLSMKWRTIISGALIGAMMLFSHLQTSQWEQFMGMREMKADWSMLPPSLLWSQPVPQADYFDRAFETFGEVDAERQRMLEEKAD